MLRVANGCTERQFPLVPQAVLLCSYDVIGTQCCDYRVSVTAFAVPRFVRESSERSQREMRLSGLFDRVHGL
jgi:hypothetical protein